MTFVYAVTVVTQMPMFTTEEQARERISAAIRTALVGEPSSANPGLWPTLAVSSVNVQPAEAAQ